MPGIGLTGWCLAIALLAHSLSCHGRLRRQAQALGRGCHEVRGPLACLRLALDAGARRGGLAPVDLAALEGEVGRAARALEDLEAVRRRCAVHARPRVDVREVAREAVTAFRLSAATADARLRLCAPPGELSAPVDPVRLRQALGNLLANAAEHGGGEVELRVGAAEDRVWLQVSDQGPGLPAPPERLTRRRRHASEHGHGLAVAVEVAAAHGGRLSQLSPAGPGADRMGGGSSLRLELPR